MSPSSTFPTQWSTSSRVWPVGGRRWSADLVVAGREGAVVVAPIHEGVDDLAVGVDRRPAQHALLALELGGLERRSRAALGRLLPGRGGVVDGEGDVVHAVAVLVDVLRDLAVGAERRGEDEADVVLDQHVAGAVPNAGLQARVSDGGEAPQGPIVGGRLLGVGDPELDVVDALEGQEILCFVGGIRIDHGASLVGGTAGDRLSHRASPWRAPSAPAPLDSSPGPTLNRRFRSRRSAWTAAAGARPSGRPSASPRSSCRPRRRGPAETGSSLRT